MLILDNHRVLLPVIIGVLLFTSSEPFGETLVNYQKKMKHLEVFSKPSREVALSIIDERFSNENVLNLELFTSELTENLKSLNIEVVSLSEQFTGLKPVRLEIEINYFNFYKTGGGTWCGKNMMQLDFIDLNKPSIIKHKPITVDIPFNRGKLKDKKRVQWQTEVIDLSVERTTKEIEYFCEVSGFDYREVTSFGSAKIQESENITIKMSILDALRNGCALAWGIQLESVTQIINFQIVEDKIAGSETGFILEYEVLSQYTEKTDDDYLCVIVRSIIANPLR